MGNTNKSRAESQASDIKGASTAQKNAALQGGGAFGSGGLTSDYQQSKNAAFTGASQAQQTGGYDPEILKQMRGNASNLALTGGIAPEAEATYKNLATNGPQISPEATNAYKDIISSGGLPKESSDLYKDYISTGGYSDADTSRYLRQATSGLKNTYSTLAADAARRRAAAGGLGGDSTSQMARQLTQAQAESTDKALSDIHQQVSANKLAGAGGLATGTTNRLTAASGLSAQDQLRLAGQTAGAGGLVDVGKARQSGFGLQAGLEGNVAGNVMSANQLQAFMASDSGKQIMSMLGLDANNQQDVAQMYATLAAQPGTFSKVMQVVNAGAQLGSAALTGGAVK